MKRNNRLDALGNAEYAPPVGNSWVRHCMAVHLPF